MKNNLYQIVIDSKIGKNTKLWRFINLYGCTIGDHCLIGSFVEIQNGVIIGDRVRVQSHTFICEGVTVENDVFIGHGVVFINDKYPRATNKQGKPITRSGWKLLPIVVKKGASIGSNATILGGVTIGEYAMVGAGSVVTKDVPDGTTVAGNPARIKGRMRP
jgi:UDP-2-acetamido-3-amino-2,3-dideoxy-glucuronate N-acetyltransferase